MAGERKAAGGANAIPRLEAARGPSEADALAFLLRTVNPRVDAEAVAGRLLERFGHLSDVFDAPAELLDSKGYLKYMDVVNEGSVRGVPLYIRELVRLCLLYDADTI